MQETEHKEIIDLIPAYALNSLDAEDAEKVNRHLASCAACQAELAAFASIVNVLPLAAPDIEPSAQLKDRLMQRIQQATTEETAVSRVPKSHTQTSWQQFTTALSDFMAGPRRRPVAVLVVFVLLLGSFLVWRQLNPPVNQFVLTPTEIAPGAEGVIEVVGNGRQATLIVNDLPQLDADRQYQLWLIKEGQRENGGVFSVNANGWQNVTIDATQPLVNYAAFGITIEPAGGSPGPTGERVLGHSS